MTPTLLSAAAPAPCGRGEGCKLGLWQHLRCSCHSFCGMVKVKSQGRWDGIGRCHWRGNNFCICLQCSAGNTAWEFQGKNKEIDIPILWKSAGFLGENSFNFCLLPWPQLKATYFYILGLFLCPMRCFCSSRQVALWRE